jgi:hypothetical protein
MSGRGADELRISGTAPGNRHPPSAQLSDGGWRIEWRVAAEPPSLRLPPCAGAGRLYKQTQFGAAPPPGGCEDAKHAQFAATSWKAGPPGGEECETNPIPGDDGRVQARGTAVGPVVQTKPIYPDVPGRPSPRPEALTLPPVTGAMARSKANSVRESRESSAFWDKSYAGLDMHAKQSQFPAGCALAGDRLCETNPISADAVWDGAAGAWDMGQSYKQSQLGEPGGGQPGADCAKQSQSAGGQEAACAAVPLIHSPSPATF